jgi:hypothetical protein
MESLLPGKFPIQKDGIFSRRELPDGGGNFPIQKDGVFFVRELPNPKGWNLFRPGSFQFKRMKSSGSGSLPAPPEADGGPCSRPGGSQL